MCGFVFLQAVCVCVFRTPYGVRGDKHALGAALGGCSHRSTTFAYTLAFKVCGEVGAPPPPPQRDSQFTHYVVGSDQHSFSLCTMHILSLSRPSAETMGRKKKNVRKREVGAANNGLRMSRFSFRPQEQDC